MDGSFQIESCDRVWRPTRGSGGGYPGKTATLGLALLWVAGCGGPTTLEHDGWNDRFTEGRLSGDVDWRPCAPHRMASADGPGSWRPCVAEVDAKIRSDLLQKSMKAARDGLPATESLLLARARLLQGGHHVRSAVVSLSALIESSASARDPTLRVNVMNDLAAALLEQSHRNGSLLDTLRALEWIEQALEQSPEHRPALFNRALILEHAHLVLTAKDAWQRYLETDVSSDWAREARHRLRDLDRELEPGRSSHGPPQGRHHQLLERLAEIWQRAEEPEIRRLTYEFARSAKSEIAASKAAEPGIDYDYDYDQSVIDGLGAFTAEGTDSVPELPTLRAFAEGYRTYVARDYQGAKPLLLEALPGLTDSPLGSWVRTWLGFIHVSNTDYGKAYRYIDEVLKSDHSKYPAISATAHWARALGLARQNYLRESLSSYDLAAELFRKTGEPALSGHIEGQIADVLTILGDDAEAWVHRHRALSMFRRLPTFQPRHNALWESARGAVKRHLGRAALAFNTEGVRVAGVAGTPLAKSEAHLRRARTLIELGRAEQAIAELETARSTNSNITDLPRRERSALSIAFSTALALSELEPKRAIQLLDEIVDYSAPREELRWLEALRHRAFLQRKIGDPEAAERDLTLALNTIERTLERLDLARRRPYLETAQDLFEAKLDLYLEERRAAEALAVLERARALHWSGSMAGQATRGPWDWLPAKTRVVAYAWVQEEIHIWLIGRQGARWIGSRPGGGLESQVERLLEAVELQTDWQPMADLTAKLTGELYGTLIEPLTGYLGEDDRLIIAPDRMLSTLPFALLRNPRSGRFLIEERPLGFTPSLEVLRRSLLTGADIGTLNTGLFVGNPSFDPTRFKFGPLPAAATEARQLARLYPGSRVLIGTEATRENLARHVTHHSLLHFAGHAQRDDHYPERSNLVLAGEPGTLSVEQLAAAADGLTLVVLSACRTGTLDDRRAASVSGLAGALLASGVPAVVGTLWDLNDEAGRLLFTAFHQALANGEGYLEAARLAQLHLLSETDGQWAHPKSWAGLQPLGYLSHVAAKGYVAERDTLQRRDTLQKGIRCREEIGCREDRLERRDRLQKENTL